jgi:hypothetical protein
MLENIVQFLRIEMLSLGNGLKDPQNGFSLGCHPKTPLPEFGFQCRRIVYAHKSLFGLDIWSVEELATAIARAF